VRKKNNPSTVFSREKFSSDTVKSMSSLSDYGYSMPTLANRRIKNGLEGMNKYSRFKKTSRETKQEIVEAIERKDLFAMRTISNYFYSVSGVYSRGLHYLADMPTYSYLITPNLNSFDVPLQKRGVQRDLDKALLFCEELDVQKTFSDITLKIFIDGAWYGYLRYNGQSYVFEELPINYCRSRYKANGKDVVEFNVKYFEDAIARPELRQEVLKTYPKEIVDGYIAYKNGVLPVDKTDMTGYWIRLSLHDAWKFSMRPDDQPFFISAVPKVIDFDDIREINKRKKEQQLQKLLIQKVPLNKDGEFIFDMEEAKALHQNAVMMLANAVNVDVLTTFTENELMEMSEDKNNMNEFEKWEKQVYNDMGISAQLFATDGNLALEKSIKADESLLPRLTKQYEDFMIRTLNRFFTPDPNLYDFSFWFPPITHYNRDEFIKTTKDLATFGYGKMLPAIAMGQTQRGFLSQIYFENDILQLHDRMVPLQSSHTSSGKGEGNGETGRPTLANDEASEKTIANRASIG
jgi:hypothetical protein